MLSRTFGCVRVVWNRMLAPLRARYVLDKALTSYRESDASPTAVKKLPELDWLAADACGGNVSRQECALALLPVKQEPVGASTQGISVLQDRE